ncbi:FAD-binding oxidoreductase [Amylibacter sp. SFDW26]|uniref:NAD(P)/FAD-dependent oxidoreductase n=1 Tax=Amylibacter sp. SFDW26 TaxID=2652722 RepID=UPI001262634E|nr:FAD-binding oxidoreductase [Amylibacter sp. SFDW26]KAB7615466.1 FAD-binding oxidoreductase [Amylibacter sp. SFDW26]
MKQKILVIGAGITGVCIAEALRRADQSVTLVDRMRPGDPAQTSYGNAGILAREAIAPILDQAMISQIPKWLLSKDSPVNIKWSYLFKLMPWAIPVLRNAMKDRIPQTMQAMNNLIYDTVDQHINFTKGTNAAAFIQKGEFIFLYPQKTNYLSDIYINDLKKSLGVQWIERDFAELKERDPALGDSYKFGAAFQNHGWLTDPAGYVASIANHFTANGGTFIEKEVVDIGPDRVTFKGGKEHIANTIILATGAWSQKLARTFGHKIPLQGERGYHIMLSNPSHKPDQPYMVTDAKYGLTPMADGLRCAGTTEFAPLDTAASKSPIDYLERSIKQVYPDLTWDGKGTWMGSRPTLADSLPMFGRTKSAPNVIYAFGGQHLGITMGPKVGQIIRDIALDKPTNIDLSPYAVDRFD